MGELFLEPNNIIFNFVVFMPLLNKIFRARFLLKRADGFFRTMIANAL